MTPVQIDTAKKLGTCRFLPGSFDKRFARDMESIAKNKPEHELTEKQSAYLEKLAYKFRRQIAGKGPSQPRRMM
jgi:hypothetical protein